MNYVITNPRSLTVGDRRVGLFFRKGKTQITGEEYEKMKGSKVLGSMLREGLLIATEQAPSPKPKASSGPGDAVVVSAEQATPRKKG